MIGLPSSGPHTNGYTLIRKVFAGVDLAHVYPELGLPLADALLAPHKSYLPDVRRLRSGVTVKGLAHITGGGFYDNIPRILPAGVAVAIRRDSWQVPWAWWPSSPPSISTRHSRWPAPEPPT